MVDSLGDRMKAYEHCSAVTLLPNTPIIIRVDGKAFHTFTKKMGFKRPFDNNYIDCMDFAARRTGLQMQNFRAAYIQSDEATFLLHSDNPMAESWFGGKVQKLTSISAAIMTNNFNTMVAIRNGDYDTRPDYSFEPAIFDSRAFNVALQDIPNVFLWRMKDWRRNSLQMFARGFFSHKELNGKNTDDMIKMLADIDQSWYNLPSRLRNGTLLFNTENTKNEYNIEVVTEFEPNYLSVGDLFKKHIDLTIRLC